MAIEQHFYLDTPASRHAVRDVLVDAGIGFEPSEDWKNTSGARASNTNVVILDDLSSYSWWPDNGVAAKCSVMFRDRKGHLDKPELEERYDTETVLGVMALLKAFPDADAYWTALDAEIPVLFRRNGRLALAQVYWTGNMSRYLPLVVLPHVMEPLGPWWRQSSIPGA